VHETEMKPFVWNQISVIFGSWRLTSRADEALPRWRREKGEQARQKRILTIRRYHREVILVEMNVPAEMRHLDGGRERQKSWKGKGATLAQARLF